MRMTWRSLGLIGLLGGLGGAINAGLCYLQLPVPVSTTGSFFPWLAGGTHAMQFSWGIIPAGMLHGGLLAVVSTGFASWLIRRGRLTQWAGVPLVGWVAGWLSWIPVQLYVSLADRGELLTRRDSLVAKMIDAVRWPFTGQAAERLVGPYSFFGFVGLLCYVCWVPCRQWRSATLGAHVLVTSCSGCLGSLWWWSHWRPWYFSLLHGAI